MIATVRTGERLVITHNCASDWHSRRDYAGATTVLSNWEQNSTSRCTVGARCTAVAEPVYPVTRIAVRPGNFGVGAVRGPRTGR